MFRRHGGILALRLRSSTIAARGCREPPILVVEDDPSLRLVCRVNLELDNFRVREADGVDEARAAVAAERPALVFLDLHLGQEPPTSCSTSCGRTGIPVVLVSGTWT